MKKPKILLYDIETSPNLAYVWGKWQQDVIAYEKERELLSIAFKWLGEDRVKCYTREGDTDDKELTKIAASLLQNADITIAHNGDEFDRKIISARMAYWGLKPLKTNCSVDTKRAAKAYFKFNGNGLNDLGTFLRLGNKHPNPGFSMWLGCIQNDPKAWELMVKYNKMDVLLLEKVYKRLRPWIQNHPAVARFYSNEGCPDCGSTQVKKDGFRVTASTVQQRWSCRSCGKYYTTRVKKDTR